MFKRILVPVDGSELSFTAVSGATRFAKPLGSTIVLFTVIEPYSYTNLSEYRPESIEQYEERVEGEANKRLATKENSSKTFTTTACHEYYVTFALINLLNNGLCWREALH